MKADLLRAYCKPKCGQTVGNYLRIFQLSVAMTSGALDLEENFNGNCIVEWVVFESLKAFGVEGR